MKLNSFYLSQNRPLLCFSIIGINQSIQNSDNLLIFNALILKEKGAKNSPLFHYNPKPEKNKNL